MSRLALPILIALLLAVPLFVHNQYFLHVMIVIGINVIMAVSMWLLGITGLISFGQAGFMFIGAMTTALLTKNAGWPFWLPLALSPPGTGAVQRPGRTPQPARQGRLLLPRHLGIRPGRRRRLCLFRKPVRRLVRHPQHPAPAAAGILHHTG